VSAVYALIWKDLGKTEVEIPEMDLYILRDSDVGINANWFDAGSGAIPFLTLL